MPLPATLADIQAYGVAEQIGLPSCDSRFIQRVNKAQRWLSECGRWYGSIAKMRFCLTQGCITFPREVAAVEKLDVCIHGVRVRNNWWEFMEYSWTAGSTTNPGCTSTSCNGQTQYYTAGTSGNQELLDRGTVCTPVDVAGGVAFIQLSSTSASDTGKTVTINGFDVNNLPIQETITLNGTATVQSTFQYAPPGLQGVNKQVTTGTVNVYAYYQASGGAVSLLGMWEPSETYPKYVRKFLTNSPYPCSTTVGAAVPSCSDNGDGCAPSLSNCSGVTVSALCRLEFIPALVPTDWLFISNLKALELAMVADYLESTNDDQGAEMKRQKAIRTLRNELDKYQPPAQITVNKSSFGSAHPNRVFGGFY